MSLSKLFVNPIIVAIVDPTFCPTVISAYFRDSRLFSRYYVFFAIMSQGMNFIWGQWLFCGPIGSVNQLVKYPCMTPWPKVPIRLLLYGF